MTKISVILIDEVQSGRVENSVDSAIVMGNAGTAWIRLCACLFTSMV